MMPVRVFRYGVASRTAEVRHIGRLYLRVLVIITPVLVIAIVIIVGVVIVRVIVVP